MHASTLDPAVLPVPANGWLLLCVQLCTMLLRSNVVLVLPLRVRSWPKPGPVPPLNAGVLKPISRLEALLLKVASPPIVSAKLL